MLILNDRCIHYIIVSSVSEVSVTCIFSCFVTDCFCCVLQCGIMSEGYSGVRTNLRYQTGLTVMTDWPTLAHHLLLFLFYFFCFKAHSFPFNCAVVNQFTVFVLQCLGFFLLWIIVLLTFGSTWHFRTRKLQSCISPDWHNMKVDLVQ